MRATKALAPLFNKTVAINNKRYFDVYGWRLNRIDVKKAIDLGATKIIVIDNENNNFLNKTLFSILIKMRGKTFSNNYYNNINNAQ
jgi:predicted patatin/cPLA2 family phospholipase